MKYLSNKKAILEFFNPILNGNDYLQAPGTSTGELSNIINDPCSDMIEKPMWLDNDEDTAYINGDVTSVGAFFINGVPLSSWSASRGGSMTGYVKQHVMQNWYYINALTKSLFPNGIQAYVNRNIKTEYTISKLSIIKMIPCNTGIGFNIYVKFNIGDSEIYGKFEKVGTDLKPNFICEEISELPIENRIKITGKIWNTILNWFKIKSGIYKCISKDVLVFSELGQLKHIKENEIIEVISSNDEIIKIQYNELSYIIKKPIYYWFNWYFIKK